LFFFLFALWRPPDAVGIWSLAGIAAFGLGLRFGHRALRGTTLVVVLAITLLTALGNA
jgi:hypothetical protein